MKSMVSVGEVIKSKPLNTRTATIASNASTIHQMTTGIYDDPQRSFPRELITNGLDGYMKAKALGLDVPDVAVEVTLPTSMLSDAELVVRDYGVGMTDEKVEEVFLVLGNSDKRECGLQTGEKGFGSKSPLSYCDLFTFACYDGSTVRQYCCYMDEERGIQLSTVYEGPSDELRGVEVRVPIKQQDMDDFESILIDLVSDMGHPHSADVPRPVLNGVAEGSIAQSWDEYKKITEYVYHLPTAKASHRHSQQEQKAYFYNANVQYKADLDALLRGSGKSMKDWPVVRRYPLAFMVPLLCPEDGLPLVATTAGRESLQPHPRTAKWLIEQLDIAEKSIVDVWTKDLCEIRDFQKRSEYWQKLGWVERHNSIAPSQIIDAVKSGKLPCLPSLSLAPIRWNAATHKWEATEKKSWYYGDYHHVKTITRIFADKFNVIPDSVLTSVVSERWVVTDINDKTKVFSRNRTTSDVMGIVDKERMVLLVDDRNRWRQRCAKAKSGGTTIPSFGLNIHDLNKIEQDEVAYNLGLRDYKVVRTSSLPKVKVVRSSNAVTSSKADKSVYKTSPPIRKVGRDSYRISDLWSTLIASDNVTAFLKEPCLYVALKGNQPIGSRLLEPNNVATFLRDMASYHTYSGFQNVFAYRETEFNSKVHSLPDSCVHLEAWLERELKFLAPVFERYDYSVQLELALNTNHFGFQQYADGKLFYSSTRTSDVPEKLRPFLSEVYGLKKQHTQPLFRYANTVRTFATLYKDFEVSHNFDFEPLTKYMGSILPELQLGCLGQSSSWRNGDSFNSLLGECMSLSAKDGRFNRMTPLKKLLPKYTLRKKLRDNFDY